MPQRIHNSCFIFQVKIGLDDEEICLDGVTDFYDLLPEPKDWAIRSERLESDE